MRPNAAFVLLASAILASPAVNAQQPDAGPAVPVIASPLHLSDNATRLDPIPSLGQDTEAILEELGYNSADIRKMKEEHAIG